MSSSLFNAVITLALECTVLLIIGISHIILKVQLALDLRNTALCALLVEHIRCAYTVGKIGLICICDGLRGIFLRDTHIGSSQQRLIGCTQANQSAGGQVQVHKGGRIHLIHAGSGIAANGDLCTGIDVHTAALLSIDDLGAKQEQGILTLEDITTQRCAAAIHLTVYIDGICSVDVTALIGSGTINHIAPNLTCCGSGVNVAAQLCAAVHDGHIGIYIQRTGIGDGAAVICGGATDQSSIVNVTVAATGIANDDAFCSCFCDSGCINDAAIDIGCTLVVKDQTAGLGQAAGQNDLTTAHAVANGQDLAFANGEGSALTGGIQGQGLASQIQCQRTLNGAKTCTVGERSICVQIVVAESRHLAVCGECLPGNILTGVTLSAGALVTADAVVIADQLGKHFHIGLCQSLTGTGNKLGGIQLVNTVGSGDTGQVRGDITHRAIGIGQHQGHGMGGCCLDGLAVGIEHLVGCGHESDLTQGDGIEFQILSCALLCSLINCLNGFCLINAVEACSLGCIPTGILSCQEGHGSIVPILGDFLVGSCILGLLGLHGGQACIGKLCGCSNLRHSLTHGNIGLFLSSQQGFGIHIAAGTGEICHIPALGSTQSIPECTHQVSGGIIHTAQQMGVGLPVGDHHGGLFATVKLYQLHGAVCFTGMGQSLAAVNSLCCPMGIAVVIALSIRIVTDIVLTGDLHRTDLCGSCRTICNGILGSLHQVGIQLGLVSSNGIMIRGQIGSCVGVGSADHDMVLRNTGSLLDGFAGCAYHSLRQGYQIRGDQQEGFVLAVGNGNGRCGQAIGFIVAGGQAVGRITIAAQGCACCRCNADLAEAHLHSVGNQTQLTIGINDVCVLVIAEHLAGRICRGVGEGRIGIGAIQGNADQTGISQVMEFRSHIQGHIVMRQTQIFCCTGQLSALVDGDATGLVSTGTSSSCQTLDAATGHAEGSIDHIQIVSGFGGSLFCLADAAAGHSEGCALQLHIIAVATGSAAVNLTFGHICGHAGIQVTANAIRTGTVFQDRTLQVQHALIHADIAAVVGSCTAGDLATIQIHSNFSAFTGVNVAALGCHTTGNGTAVHIEGGGAGGIGKAKADDTTVDRTFRTRMLQGAAVQVDGAAAVQEDAALVGGEITGDLAGLALAAITHINVSQGCACIGTQTSTVTGQSVAIQADLQIAAQGNGLGNGDIFCQVVITAGRRGHTVCPGLPGFINTFGMCLFDAQSTAGAVGGVRRMGMVSCRRCGKCHHTNDGAYCQRKGKQHNEHAFLHRGSSSENVFISHLGWKL